MIENPFADHGPKLYNLRRVSTRQAAARGKRMASETGSVSEWIRQLQAGDPQAAQKLWERYFDRLIALAHKGLRAVRRCASDEEDVALSAFATFWRRAARGHVCVSGADPSVPLQEPGLLAC
jgi:hypothetical protein